MLSPLALLPLLVCAQSRTLVGETPEPVERPLPAVGRVALVRVNAPVAVLRGLDLDLAARITADTWDVIADAEDCRGLIDAGIDYEVRHLDLEAHYASRLLGPDQIPARLGTPALGAWLTPVFGAGGLGGYYTYDEVVSVLDQIHAAYPSITTAKFSIGTTIEGRTIWALKVSDNPGTDENEPEARIDAMHHAREPESMQSTLWALLALVERYGSDPLSTYLVDERETWFIPVVNPDGYERNRATNPSGGGLWRKNRRNNGDGTFGVDLNRNYEYQWGFDNLGSEPFTNSEIYRGTAPASEPEVQAMQAFISSRDFQTAISAHTYSNLWLSPWGYIAAAPANGADYDELGGLCVQDLGWPQGPAGSILYLANGGTFDYDHGVHGTMGFTPEIGGDSDGFWPATSRIVPLAESVELPFLRTIQAAGPLVLESSRTLVDAGDGDGAWEPGETVEVVVAVRNSGRGASGALELELTSSDPDVTITTGLVNVGPVGSFAGASNAGQPLALTLSPTLALGDAVALTLAIRHDGYTQSSPLTLTVGAPRLLVVDDLESDLGWTSGAPGDGATTGLWAWGNPVGTTSGGPSNPEDDATPGPGVRCWTTGNGSTTAGGDDVDGGPTSLTTPRLDLSMAAGAVLRMQRWFANFTQIDDQLAIQLSDDDGASWTTALTISGGSENSWQESSIDVQQHVGLTDEVRVRFVASDDPNNSVTEAAIDDLEVEVWAEGPLLSAWGEPALGAPLALHVNDQPGRSWFVYVARDPAQLPLVIGKLRRAPYGGQRVASGTIPETGLARVLWSVPNDPSLAGATLHARALTLRPGATSNTVTIRIP
jgi:hypothetical protein